MPLSSIISIENVGEQGSYYKLPIRSIIYKLPMVNDKAYIINRQNKKCHINNVLLFTCLFMCKDKIQILHNPR